eukprot:scaffold10805_cov21-Tisochrysis_lutea.AAC.4
MSKGPEQACLDLCTAVAVLVCDVNQALWTNEPLWSTDYSEEGQGMLSWILPRWMRKWVRAKKKKRKNALSCTLPQWMYGWVQAKKRKREDQKKASLTTVRMMGRFLNKQAKEGLTDGAPLLY